MVWTARASGHENANAIASLTPDFSAEGGPALAGDLIVAAIRDVSTETAAFNTPAGYTAETNLGAGWGVFWKVATGGENSVTISKTSGTADMMAAGMVLYDTVGARVATYTAVGSGSAYNATGTGDSPTQLMMGATNMGQTLTLLNICWLTLGNTTNTNAVDGPLTLSGATQARTSTLVTGGAGSTKRAYMQGYFVEESTVAQVTPSHTLSIDMFGSDAWRASSMVEQFTMPSTTVAALESIRRPIRRHVQVTELPYITTNNTFNRRRFGG